MILVMNCLLLRMSLFFQFNSVHVDRSEVQTLNHSVNIRKSPGPDGRGRRKKNVLKSLQIFSVLFSPSLQHQQVPGLSNDSIITPAAKS